MIRKCPDNDKQGYLLSRPDVSKKAIVCVFVHLFFSVPVPVVSLEKIPNLVKADGANVKMNSTTTPAVPSCSTSSSAVSTPPVIKPVLMSKSVPPSPEKILNGKGILSTTIDKKHQNGTKNNSKPYRRLSGTCLYSLSLAHDQTTAELRPELGSDAIKVTDKKPRQKGKPKQGV